MPMPYMRWVSCMNKEKESRLTMIRQLNIFSNLEDWKITKL